MMRDMSNAIVWIHGFPLSSAIFERQMSLDGFTHVAPDLPGFGKTPPREQMSIDDYAAFVLDHVESRGAIFAGLSMGGYIAFHIVRTRPELVKGLILIDTRETPDSPDQKKGRLETIEKVKQNGIGVVVDSMLPKMVGPDAPPTDRDRVREIMNSSSPQGVIAALGAMADRADSSDLLPNIAVPTLIVVGEEDAITPPSDAERMARAIPNAKLVRIPRAAHLSNFEKASEFNAAVQTMR
jgi:3-oxoadipate enol-lactonase